MNYPVYIHQMAAISSIGNTSEEIFSALMDGKTGIRINRRFDCSNYSNALCALISDLDSAIPGKSTSRLLEMLLDQIQPVPRSAMTFLATTKGGIDQLQQQCRVGTESEASTGEIHGTLEQLKTRLRTERSGVNINAACASSTIALAQASSLIRNGLADDCLLVAYDLVTEFTHSGFSIIKAASDDYCRPFDIDRKGLNLGESAALLHLSNRRHKNPDFPSVRILGSGISSDAAHITAPARDAAGLIRACEQAFSKAGISKTDIAAISAHGTGTVYNDAMEITGFNALFDGSLPPLFSIKGATGHTLGTAGALETIVSTFALGNGSIPPTIGCVNAAPEARGKVCNKPQNISGGFRILKTNSGFGGINAALILSMES